MDISKTGANLTKWKSGWQETAALDWQNLPVALAPMSAKMHESLTRCPVEIQHKWDYIEWVTDHQSVSSQNLPNITAHDAAITSTKWERKEIQFIPVWAFYWQELQDEELLDFEKTPIRPLSLFDRLYHFKNVLAKFDEPWYKKRERIQNMVEKKLQRVLAGEEGLSQEAVLQGIDEYKRSCLFANYRANEALHRLTEQALQAWAALDKAIADHLELGPFLSPNGLEKYTKENVPLIAQDHFIKQTLAVLKIGLEKTVRQYERDMAALSTAIDNCNEMSLMF